MDTNNIIEDLQALSHNRRRRMGWKPFFEKYKINTICEIGVREGLNFGMMIEHNPTLAGAIGRSQASGKTTFTTPCLSGLQNR